MSAVVQVEKLGKKYLISHQRRRESDTLREEVSGLARRAWQRVRHPVAPNRATTDIEEMWALKEVDFQVEQGERLGIIGRNGAGKSTLLKILSRIVEPTTGRVRLLGRVSSLLEVGTGFHPELSGRENIFLNGAILGMTSQEIRTKFDEIVAFAEIERFLDTPVKRYSSGMYVRLAFAVAAHLEPEILIVDEVLAVGDDQFQKKCLGKMSEVAKEGRTVLFVSHNMAAVQRFCSRALLLKEGRLAMVGDTEDVLAAYLAQGADASLRWKRNGVENPHAPCYFTEIWLADEEDEPLSSVPTGGVCRIYLDFVIRAACRGLNLGVGLLDGSDEQIFGTTPPDAGVSLPEAPGEYRACLVLPADLFMSRPYGILAVLWHPQMGTFDRLHALRFTPYETACLANSTAGGREGMIALRCDWSVAQRPH